MHGGLVMPMVLRTGVNWRLIWASVIVSSSAIF